jgi:hypothetical protein
LVLALCASPAPALAQQVRGFGQAFNVERRIYYRGAVYQQTGLWYGAAGSAALGPIQVGVSSFMGTAAGGGTASPDIKVRTTAVTVHYQVASWMALGVQAEARRFDSDAGATIWRMIGASARLEPGLGVAGLRGIADVSVLPASSVSGGPSLDMAVQATVGLAWAPSEGPVDLRLGYRFERYDIAGAGATPARYEQYRGVSAGVGIRLGR